MSKNILRNKSGFQMSFAWIFAMIAGAFILFLAIYLVVQFLDTGDDVSNIRTGTEIGILIDTLESGVESGQTASLRMPLETRIHNRCDPSGTFGTQMIGISQRTRGDWSQSDLNATFRNKYLFSKANVEGREFFLFSKPLELPFEIANLVYITSSNDDYCFVKAPERIEDELGALGQENLFTGDSISDCSENSVKVCFDEARGPDCDILVNSITKQVQKEDRTSYYETDSLMYAAIFSNPDIYECQIQRIVKRADELASIYEEKARILSSQSCTPDVDLASYRNALNIVDDSINLVNVAGIAGGIDSQNSREECRLW